MLEYYQRVVIKMKKLEKYCINCKADTLHESYYEDGILYRMFFRILTCENIEFYKLIKCLECDEKMFYNG